MRLEDDDVSDVVPDPEPPKCGHKKKHGGECTQAAGWGTDHPGVGYCKFHGGRSPGVAVASYERRIRQIAAVEAVEIDINPEQALLKCVRLAHGDIAFAQEQIDRLELMAADGVAFVRTQSTKVRPLSLGKEGEDPGVQVEEVTTNPAELHAWFRFRADAMDRLAKYSKMCIDAQISERLVHLEEEKAKLFAGVMFNVLSDLGYADDPRAPAIVRSRLAVLDGNTIEGTATEL